MKQAKYEGAWWVYSRRPAGGWVKSFGPMSQREATESASKLESMNHSGLTPFFVAAQSAPSDSFLSWSR